MEPVPGPAQVTALLVGRLREGLVERGLGVGAAQGRGEDVADQVVTTRRQRDRELAVGAEGELAGPAGPGTGAVGEPPSSTGTTPSTRAATPPG